MKSKRRWTPGDAAFQDRVGVASSGLNRSLNKCLPNSNILRARYRRQIPARTMQCSRRHLRGSEIAVNLAIRLLVWLGQCLKSRPRSRTRRVGVDQSAVSVRRASLLTHRLRRAACRRGRARRRKSAVISRTLPQRLPTTSGNRSMIYQRRRRGRSLNMTGRSSRS